MSKIPNWLVFTIVRLLLVAVPFVIMLVLGIDGWLAAVIATVIGLSLSYIFLAKRRNKISTAIYERRQRPKDVPSADELHEDAVADALGEKGQA